MHITATWIGHSKNGKPLKLNYDWSLDENLAVLATGCMVADIKELEDGEGLDV